MKRRTVVLLTLVIVTVFTVMFIREDDQQGATVSKNIGAAELIRFAEDGHIQRAQIQGGEITAFGNGTIYKVYTREPEIVTKVFRERKVVYVEAPVGNDVGGMLLQFLLIGVLPIFLLIFLIRLMFRGQGPGNQMSVGKHKGRLINESKDKATFADVAGVDEAVEESKEIVDFLKNPRKYLSVGAHVPKGILLVGAPGCGKTLLARAIAGEAGVPFFSVSASSFVEMFVGVGASRVRDLFEQAAKHAPCIVFIDEIDAIGKKRAGATYGGGHDEREQTLNELLVAMDGFSASTGIIIIAATNQPEILDEALTRKGRFDRTVVVHRPDTRGREAILKVHLRGKTVTHEADIALVAKGTYGMSGADLESLVNEATLAIAKDGRTILTQDDLMRARDRVVMGPERKSVVISAKEKEITAYHEGGHTLAAWFTPHADSVHRVSIVPRGKALGLTWSTPDDDANSQSRDQLLAMICMMMGGRAAEELIYGEGGITTGASNDLERATNVAEFMVKKLGMSKVGLQVVGAGERAAYYGINSANSEFTARRIDRAVEAILRSQYDRAKQILTKNLPILEALKNLLIEKETVDHEDIVRLAGAKLVPGKTPVPG